MTSSQALAHIDASIAKLHGTQRDLEAKHKNFTEWQKMARLQREAEDDAYANHHNFNHI